MASNSADCTLGGGAVHLVDEDQRVEQGAGQELEGARILAPDGGAGEVGRHQVGRALHAGEGAVEPVRQTLDRAGLGETRSALDQQMAAGQKPDQQALDQLVGADQPMAQSVAELEDAVADGRRLRRGPGECLDAHARASAGAPNAAARASSAGRASTIVAGERSCRMRVSSAWVLLMGPTILPVCPLPGRRVNPAPRPWPRAN
jgi:hypothetical protein